MLILPAEKKLNWRKPPVITLLLIIINCVVFFGYQLKDGQLYDQLIEDFQSSEFSEQEITLYSEHLSKTDPEKWASIPLDTDIGEEMLIGSLLHDLDFEKSLRTNSDFPGSEWEMSRILIEKTRNQVSFVKYGFNPAKPSFIDAFASMFLHGDFGHLLGNMVFLFIFGFALEAVMGRGAYLATYLLTGFAATGLYWAMEWQSNGFGVGASGAISGLMGAYLGVYRNKRIQFFYWIGPYFNFFKAPALIIFPIWLGKEAIGQFLSTGNVNYWAHIGGLLGGAGITLLARPWLNLANDEVNKPVETPLMKAIKQFDHLANELQYDKALLLIERLYRDNPENTDIIQRLYPLRKRKQDKAFHQLVLAIIKLPKSPESDQLAGMMVRDYLKTPLLLKNEKVSLFWLNKLLLSGQQEEALLLIQYCLGKTANKEQFLPALNKLVNHYRNRNEKQHEKLVSMLHSIKASKLEKAPA